MSSKDTDEYFDDDRSTLDGDYIPPSQISSIVTSSSMSEIRDKVSFDLSLDSIDEIEFSDVLKDQDNKIQKRIIKILKMIEMKVRNLVIIITSK